MQIIQAPNEILRTVTKPLNFAGPRLQKIIEDMKATLLAQKDPEGVGLAANQVGLPYSMFLARFDPKKNGVNIFINPEIIGHSEELQPDEKEKKPQLEGCLSKPQYYGLVKRCKWIRLKYYVLGVKGGLEEREDTFEEFPATVIQHEMDHLNGKIFIERILEQKGKLYKIAGKDDKGKEIWDEVEI